MRTTYLIIIGLYFFGFGKAAGQNITGILLNSATEEPVAYVGIEVQGTQGGGQSNGDGSFSLTVEQFPASLTVTALGFHTKELIVEEQVEGLVVYLNPQLESLSEVVLRSTIIPNSLQQTPSSVSVLTSEDFVRFDQTSIMKSVNTVPGVFVHQGALNTNKLSIRGVGARSQYSTNRVRPISMGSPFLPPKEKPHLMILIRTWWSGWRSSKGRPQVCMEQVWGVSSVYTLPQPTPTVPKRQLRPALVASG